MRNEDILFQDFNPGQIDICARCEKRLEELYPQGIPAEALSRYRQELLWMKQYQCEEVFQFMTALHELAASRGAVLSLRGGIGGSFLLYLLCKGRFNPLPAHYYCPSCGHYEDPDEYRYAPDMPHKKCPVCGSAMRADGFSVPAYDTFGVDGSEIVSRWNLAVSEKFMPYVKALLKKYNLHNFTLCGCCQCDRLEKARQNESCIMPEWSADKLAEIGWEKIAKIESSDIYAGALAILKPQNFRQIMTVLWCVTCLFPRAHNVERLWLDTQIVLMEEL